MYRSPKKLATTSQIQVMYLVPLVQVVLEIGLVLTTVPATAQLQVAPEKPNASTHVPGKVHIHPVPLLSLTRMPVLIRAVKVM